MYCTPAFARFSGVSSVCVRPGPSQPTGRVPVNFSITFIERSIIASWSVSLWIGCWS